MRTITTLAAALLLATGAALAQGALAALNRKDIDALLAFLHPNVVVTWQNAEVSRGRDAVRAYLQRMLVGPDSRVEDFTTTVKVDELTILYGGDTGIAFGSSQDYFNLRGDHEFSLAARWTATAVREDGRWLIAAVHSSTNLFDNPMVDGMRRLLWWVGGAALLAGLLGGFFAGRRSRKPA